MIKRRFSLLSERQISQLRIGENAMKGEMKLFRRSEKKKRKFTLR